MQIVRRQFTIQLVPDHPGLDPYPLFFDVELQQMVHVLRKVQHHARPRRLSGEACSTTPRRDWHRPLVGQRNGGQHVLFVTRHDDTGRHDLVVTGIRCVNATAYRVDKDVTFDDGPQPGRYRTFKRFRIDRRQGLSPIRRHPGLRTHISPHPGVRGALGPPADYFPSSSAKAEAP